MRGSKAKILRRICWTDKPNKRSRSVSDLKKEYPKGVPICGYAYYPRAGRDWKSLVNGE